MGTQENSDISMMFQRRVQRTEAGNKRHADGMTIITYNYWASLTGRDGVES